MILYFAQGKLGNQIFQYAFLTTIAKPNERIIVFLMDDLFDIFEVYNRNLKNIKIGNNKYIRFLLSMSFNKCFSKFFRILANFKIVTYIEQKNLELEIKKGVLPLKVVNNDYFQSEIFFDKIVLEKIKIKEEYIEEAKKILDKLPPDYQRVFVHIRRGDYVGLYNLPKKYYLKAINELKNEVKKPFYIFLSDDPDYVEDCFEDIQPKFVSRNKMGVDFALMTLCEYGICSNSTFSWWGAYLMRHRKKVIFPKYWMGWRQKSISHLGIYPQFATIIEVE